MPLSPQLAQVLYDLIRPGDELAISAYDGSRAGPEGAPVEMVVKDPRALNCIVTAFGDLGMARAYVVGYLDVVGDLYQALVALSAEKVAAVPLKQRLSSLRRLGLEVLIPVPPPPEEVRPSLWWGWRHSIARDSRAISHHYDVSNRFYEWLLGPSMAYTCAVYPYEGASLEEAQEEKVDLVCRKLDLRPGQRLLDVGCGWGTMVVHAAANYGVKVLGVTLSAQQALWAQKRIAELGLAPLAEVRHCDYRQVPEAGFDAISSIGLTEHIGAANLASYFSFLASRLAPQGRLLNHCITRPVTYAPARTGGFMNRYVFPDGELEAVGTIISAMQDNGFEVRHEENLRDHYALTCQAWGQNLEAHWDEAVREVGERRARVWKLYLAASRLGFEQRRIELHQVLGVKTQKGRSGMPLVRSDYVRRSVLS